MRWLIPLLLALLLGVPSLGRAQDYAIEVKARARKMAESVDAKYPASEKTRAVLTTAVDTPIHVLWSVRKTDKEMKKDVLVHFFVVKIDKANQQEVPKLTKNVIAESALTMDFKASDQAQGEYRFTVPNPGRYLLRLELKSTGSKDSGDPLAALELLVR